MYDLIIVGLGAAGISAAIYAKRSNLKVLCLEKGMPGGIILPDDVCNRCMNVIFRNLTIFIVSRLLTRPVQ